MALGLGVSSPRSSQPHWRLPLLSREAPLWKGLFLDIEPHIHTTSGRTLRVARIQAAYVHTSVCVCERVSALGPCAHACLRMSQAWAGACGRCCSAFLGISAPRVLTKVPQCHWRGEDNWGHSRRGGGGRRPVGTPQPGRGRPRPPHVERPHPVEFRPEPVGGGAGGPAAAPHGR